MLGQDTLTGKNSFHNQYFIHFYPSAIVAGDIALGFEHLTKSKFGQEISMSYKALPTKFYYYNKGFGADYFAKYSLCSGKVFRLSLILSLSYEDIYFNDKEINYYYLKLSPKQKDELYQTLLENRRRLEYGSGLGISINFKLCKYFSIGADLIAFVVKNRETYNYKVIIYRNPSYPEQNQIQIPSTYIKENPNLYFSPLVRFKISYVFNKT